MNQLPGYYFHSIHFGMCVFHKFIIIYLFYLSFYSQVLATFSSETARKN